ncbi:MAG: MFS transporter [Pseudomonadota bacterium]
MSSVSSFTGDANKPEPRASAPLIAVSSILISMGLLALGTGLLHAYVPLRLAQIGQPPWVAGTMVSALAFGGLIGCFAIGWVVRRVSHARTYVCMAAVIVISALLLSLGNNPWLWVLARALYGFAATGLFVVAQSWLNDASENQWRGRVLAVFYMMYVVGIGIGGYMLRLIELNNTAAPMLAILFVTLSMLPIGLTRLNAPPPPESIAINVRAVWRISPVGLGAMIAVGGLTMMSQGFVPIFATSSGFSKDDVALLYLLMQFGMFAIQLPLGAISDRTDRRFVLIAACVLVITSAVVINQMSVLNLFWLIPVFAIWAGATESIYSLANAHANDRADPQYFVALSSTLLVAWSVSGIVVPAVTSALMPIYGPKSFIYVTIFIAGALSVFVLFRLLKKDAVPQEDTDPYQHINSHVPYPTELVAIDEPVEQAPPGDKSAD